MLDSLKKNYSHFSPNLSLTTASKWAIEFHPYKLLPPSFPLIDSQVNQAWVKYVIVLNSDTVVHFTELVWCIRTTESARLLVPLVGSIATINWTQKSIWIPNNYLFDPGSSVNQPGRGSLHTRWRARPASYWSECGWCRWYSSLHPCTPSGSVETEEGPPQSDPWVLEFWWGIVFLMSVLQSDESKLTGQLQ